MNGIKRFLLLALGFALGCGGGDNSGAKAPEYRESKTEGSVKVLGQEASFQRTNREPVSRGETGKKP